MLSLFIAVLIIIVSQLVQLPTIVIISLITIVLYISALMGVLAQAKWPILIILASLPIYAIVFGRAQGLRSIFIGGGGRLAYYLSLIVTIALYACYSNFTLAIWDEFSHWGTIVKYLHFNEKLPVPAGPIRFVDYIPGVSLFQYWIQSFSTYEEHVLVFTQAFIIFSLLSVMIQGAKSDELPSSLFALSLTVGLIYSLNGSFTSLFVDTMLGTSWASALIFYFRKSYSTNSDKERILALGAVIPISAFIVLIKASGIFFSYAAIAFIFLHFALFVIPSVKTPFLRAFAVFLSGFLLVTPIIVAKSWVYYLTSIHVPVAAYSADFGIFWSALFTDKVTPESQTVHLFIEALFSSSRAILHPVLRLIPLSVTGLVACYALLIASVSLKIKNSQLRADYLILNGYLFVIGIIYCVGLLNLYLTKFPTDGSLGQGSYARYITTYFYGWGAALLYSSADLYFKGSSRRNKNILYIASFALISLALILPLKYRNFYREVRDPLRSLAEEVKAVVPENSNILFLQQESDGFEFWIFRYEMIPHLTVPERSWSIGEPYSKNDVWTRAVSISQWREELRYFDFVVIGRADKKFWEQFGPVFRRTQYKNIQGIYKVRRTGGEGVFLDEVSGN